MDHLPPDQGVSLPVMDHLPPDQGVSLPVMDHLPPDQGVICGRCVANSMKSCVLGVTGENTAPGA